MRKIFIITAIAALAATQAKAQEPKNALEQSLQEQVDREKPTLPKRNNAFETWDDVSSDGHFTQ